ncbi:MAG: phosphoribosylaminoimidazolesuccinocarboxamide synthase [Pseudomonadota bacterium]
MTAATAVLQSDIDELTLLARGKVRDIYAVNDDLLAIVATDRLSAYDVILPDPVPGKGALLTTLSRHWFAALHDTIPNHLTDLELTDVVSNNAANRALNARTMVVKRLQPLPMEAVVRGYLIGSGYKDYLRTGEVCGIALPEHLPMAAALESPLFTPATKAAVGDHDENVSFETLCAIIGEPTAAMIRDVSVTLYQKGAAYAAERGIIIADTKFEFGTDAHGTVHLIDEVLTPDSSRFWPADQYEVGVSPPSFDKQYVRDYLETLDWDKTAPGPSLPSSVLDGTLERYQRAVSLLIG